ncbi:ATP-binding protein [Sanguibacter sp. HDW7]|uniref:ATP-binding protein n=1 Tax=Sanguibacter sp. HDW7 TaxID=2714931 RepID=UPI00140A5FF1|nr:ATP-binding protein [Sanguibacter sp. HDW7]QIK83047.1 ATP-binding protein [Sanguibacter sp. HDW7]
MSTIDLGTPLRDVLGRIDEAVARREAVGWDHGGTARTVCDVVRADLAGSPLAHVAETRLLRLAHRVGLDPVSARVLAAALLPELHPLGLHLTGLLAGDGEPARPTTSTALEIAGAPATEPTALGRLSASAPLRATGLLTPPGDHPLPARRVVVPERVADHLRGDDTPARLVLDLLEEPVAVAVDGVGDVISALERDDPLVWVESGPGATGAALAAAACTALGLGCLVADLGHADVHLRPGDVAGTGDVVDALLLEALLAGQVLVLVGAEAAAASVPALLASPVPVVAVGARRWDARWATWLPTTVVAPVMTTPERTVLWRRHLDGATPGPTVTTLRLAPQDVARAAARARADAPGADPDDAALGRAVRMLGRGGTGRGSGATLDDLVLPEHARAEIERLVAWGRHRDDVAALGDIHGKGGKGTGVAALFSGSPGTGKTLAAHVVADSLGMELFQVDLSAIVDKYVGETEKNLEKIFAEAEQLNCVLFVDEADALFGKRSSVGDSRDRYANQEVAYLLQRMEVFDGITVLATNLRGNLDPAFARRLQFMVHFPDPDEATRVRLWQHHLAQLPTTDPDDPVDVGILAARLEVAGGDIRNVVLAATHDAVATGDEVGMRHLTVAAGRELAKLGRRSPGF